VTSQQAYNDALKPFLDRFTTTTLKTGDQITGFQIRLYTPIGSATDGNGISVEETDLMFMGSLMPKAYVLHRRAEREARRRYQVATQRRSDSGGKVRGGVPPDVSTYLRDAMALHAGIDTVPVSKQEAEGLSFHVPFPKLTVSDAGDHVTQNTQVMEEAKIVRRWKRHAGTLTETKEDVPDVAEGLFGSLVDDDSDRGHPFLSSADSSDVDSEGGPSRTPPTVRAPGRGDYIDSDDESVIASDLGSDNEGVGPDIWKALTRLNQSTIDQRAEAEDAGIATAKSKVINARRAGRMIPAFYEFLP
jgi:hypothetical protein